MTNVWDTIFISHDDRVLVSSFSSCQEFVISFLKISCFVLSFFAFFPPEYTLLYLRIYNILKLAFIFQGTQSAHISYYSR